MICYWKSYLRWIKYEEKEVSLYEGEVSLYEGEVSLYEGERES